MSTLLVASGGGHLVELVELAPRLSGVDRDFIWVTWDSPQSRSMLRGLDSVFVRPTPPRDPVAVARNFDFALQLWGRRKASALVTSGSQLVLPFLMVGRAHRRPCHFIESAARIHAPSLTARMASHIPGVSMYSQYHSSEHQRWPYVGSVFDGFHAVPRTADTPPSRFVVTLGTMPRWQFRSLIEACLSVIPPGSEVLWQTGETDVSGLAIDGRESIPAGELEAAMRDADVVISHAGVGSALTALHCGKFPILVPRRVELGEHVDDHQAEIAAELGRRGLALITDPDQLSADHLREAGEFKIETSESLNPIELAPASDARGARWRTRGR
jgi:UDP-N-acetylglucosamine--N-acetylmuramyl-(pentapeptide) pyrophosphoryl-undecaprenol N-acetylglucosamine transferase